MSQPTQGPVLKERVWRFIEALLTCAEDSPNFDVGWETDRNTDRPNLVVKTKRRFLESLAQLKKQELTDVIKSLENLQIWDDRRLRRGKGSEIGLFALKLWSKDAQRNREQFERVWEGSRTPKSKALEATYNKSKDSAEASQSEIDWRDVCRNRLEKQKQLTTNRLMHAKQMLFDINRICVDLALVERKQPDNRSGDDNPAQSQLYKPDYEETQKLEYEEFLARVLKASQSNKIAIIGEPGAGKTTLLQRIAFWILDNTDGFPIWIPLGNLPTPAPKLKDYLLHNWLEDAILNVTPKIRAEFEEMLTAGRVWLLLDGVDEMVAKSGNPLSFIDNWIPGWCQQLSVVLTCRLNVWEANPHALNNFQTYRTLEFSQEKVNEFIEACFQESNPALGTQLQQALNQPGKERIKDLIRNPLRLTLLCSTWHLRQGKLPDTKAELYQQFVEEVYRWKKDEFPTTPEQREQLNAKLKVLALEAIDKEENRFCLRHKFVEGILGDPGGSVFQLALNIGWLNRVGVDAKNPNPNQPVYAFFHPTFQEYFAALAIDDWDFFLPRAHDNHNPKPVSERYRIFEPQWKEVILLWLGRLNEEVDKEQKEEFIKALIEFEGRCGNFYGSRAYFLAAAGIAEFKNCSLADTVVEKTVDYCFGVFDDKEKTWSRYLNPIPWLAQEALLETDSNRVIKAIAENKIPFINKVSKYSPDLQTIGIKSAEVLGSVGIDNSEAIKILVQLINNNNPNFVLVSFDAAKTLVKIGLGNKEAIISLTRLLQTVQNKQVKITVAWTLGKIESENPFAINCLTELMNSSQSQEIRLQAAWYLLDIYDSHPIAISTLEELSRSQNKNISREASAVLEQRTVITYEHKEPEDYSPEEISVAQEACNNSDSVFELLREDKPELARREAIFFILESANCNYTETLAALVDQLDVCKDTFSLQLIIEILGEVAVGDENVVKHLIRFMRTNSPLLAATPRALSKILQGDLLSLAVVGLKDYLQNEDYKSNLFRYEQIHQVIWYCAQNMTYSTFYQAWHPQEELGKTTTSDRQTLNQADLPQSLQSAIANDPQLSQTIHLICIDGSQFIERDRPAAEIYDQMLDQNCPECDSVPETMLALKLYWSSLKRKSDKRVVLVFYASSTDTTSAKDIALPCPYSETFLTDLSKFGDRICVVTNQSIDPISLQFFAPSQSIEDVMEWIRAIATEQ
jgi:DNA replication protein DnaC